MTTQVQRRRGTTAQHATFAGAPGEITIDTDKTTAVVHDGSTMGGTPLARESDFAAAVRFDALQSLSPEERERARANIGAVDGSERFAADLFRPGQVVQEVVTQSTVDDVTTSATMQNTSLVASITPLFSSSIIEAMAIVPNVHVVRVSGTSALRFGTMQIRNMTDGVDVSPEFGLGRILFDTSTAAANTVAHAVVIGRYQVSSTALRQFRLRVRCGAASLTEIRMLANASPATMILREIRQ